MLRLFTSPGMRHVWVIVPSGRGLVFYEWHARGAHIIPVSDEWAAAHVRETCDRGGVVLVSPVWRPEKPCPLPVLAVMTCVPAVAQLLGFRAWWALTPRLLFGALRRRGAFVLLDGRSGKGSA